MSTIVVISILLVTVLFIFFYFSGPALPPETDAIIDQVISGELPELIVGQTGLASSHGLDIWYESLSPEYPAKGVVLLLMGQGGDALIWPPKFVHAFMGAGYQVIRYDHRGTGMSDWMAGWNRKNPYSLADMAEDAIAILDALEVPQAHLVGLSMGGMIAQEIAIRQPERVASLTLMMTSGFVGDPELPGLSSRYFLSFARKGIPLFKYRLMGGEKNLIKERLVKTISGAGYEGLDIKETAEVVLYDLRKRRGINLNGAWQHFTAITFSGSRVEKLRTVTIPTLVIHGTADQLIPIAHGQKLVEMMPNATGLWLEGLGHVFPPPDMQSVLQAIFSHLANSQFTHPT